MSYCRFCLQRPAETEYRYIRACGPCIAHLLDTGQGLPRVIRWDPRLIEHADRLVHLARAYARARGDG